MAAVDTAARSELTIEITMFMPENAITGISLYEFCLRWLVYARNR